MDRHETLVAGCLLLLVALAGCSAAGSLDMQRVTDDAAIAEQASRSATLPEAGPTRDRQVVRRAIENGSTTAQSPGPLVESGLPFAHDGGYYNVTPTVIDREPGVAVEVAIDYDGNTAGNETVAYDDLSARDRDVLDSLLPARTDNRGESDAFGVVATYNETERERSVLLSGAYGAVRHDGETYRTSVDDSRPVTVKTYRYTATAVATSPTEYASQLRDRHLFTLSGLSDDERAVVEEATENGYYADDDDDDAFRSVLATFHQYEAIQQDEYRGTWLVRYEEAVYVVDLSYGGFDGY